MKSLLNKVQALPKQFQPKIKNLLNNKIYFNYVKSNVPFKEDNFKYTTNIDLSKSTEIIETFRAIDLQGNLLKQEYDNIPTDILNKIFETMVYVDEVDSILYMAQRQGKISFYMTSFGETACTVASAAALKDQDFIFPQYREQGALVWRGFTVQDMVNQCIGNVNDIGKGRQMPIHYGSKALNYVTVSSPLATQIPQASGAGYGFRINNEDKIAVTYFGEGAASEGDFHSALNFASTLKCQTLFLCRNNKYAISTPQEDQLKKGIAYRGSGYNMSTLSVDGNDAIAVYHAVKEAREFIVKNKEPVLIEFQTYRIGDHSTSDHSVLYRDENEINSWKANNNPISRLGLYLKKTNRREFNDQLDKEMRNKYRQEAINALKTGAGQKFPSIDNLFEDVYDKLTPNLVEQKQQLENHLKAYGENYNLNKYHQ